MVIPMTRYVLGRSERAIFGEIYFPKRAAYQSAIFEALRHGHDERLVKRYLRRNAGHLLEELGQFPRLFDPHYYETATLHKMPPTVAAAYERFDMYHSSFRGWSVYSVDGVFFDREGQMYEEATQVVRMMFRFESSFAAQAEGAGCSDVLRSMLFWAISRQARLADNKPWSPGEQARFVEEHAPWSKRKRAFVQRYFADIIKEVAKWIDDAGLFVFGYLIRKFSAQVLIERLREEEIWATSLFNLTLSVVRRTEQS
ncbi:MAG: hypothetical protein G01um101438_716 [Parcubacteria group bacterium Gr01-1014_38]|nr:MAG: hypothetical protein G01um101438_716 [Parcubacteria group bacterium Gr01-1014_38]